MKYLLKSLSFVAVLGGAQGQEPGAPAPPSPPAAAVAPPSGTAAIAAPPPTESGTPANVQKPEDHAVSAELQSYLEPFLYDLKDRKDPFKPFVENEGGASAEGDFEGPLLPLQRYDLDEIRLIGIIWDVREPKAMFMDPNSQIHILSREERIGKNNGYLAVIREGEVVIIENIKAKGEMIRSPRVLKISR